MKKLLFVLLFVLALPVAAKEYYNEEYNFSLEIPDYYSAENPANFLDEDGVVMAFTDQNDGSNMVFKVEHSDEYEVEANEVLLLRKNMKNYLDIHHLKPYANGITKVNPNHMGMFFYCHSGHGVDHLLFQFCAHHLVYTLKTVQPLNPQKTNDFTKIIQTLACKKH